MCGCVTDTYSHLKNYLKIQKAIRSCLMQAKIGDVKGSYCERLMAVAVCDIATNVILPEILRATEAPRSAPGLEGEAGDRNVDFFSQIQKTDKAMNQRYEGTFMSKTGLQSDQIVNKVCMGAFTGDWGMFTEDILSEIDENEVEPSFGPLFATSRMQTYILLKIILFAYSRAITSSQRIARCCEENVVFMA